ncbi:MAG TPA: molecular chaperone HtpG [Rhodothermales bacterium]|nr:molecular chaperone HtpG [Rhodothermales bacterium]
MAEQQETVQEFEYRAEMKQLLHLIVHALYTHRDIFLRELISNASDALNKVRFRQLTDTNIASPDAALKVEITADAEQNTLTIADTGIGMTREDLTDRLGTVASSGTRAFLEEMKQTDKPIDAEMIGQFGVGFYAVFMVVDRVTVETRHADLDAQSYRWQSEGEGSYTIEEIDRAERGTTITLHLKEDAEEFSKEARIRQIIQKYSNFVDFPIYLAGTQVNTVKALWRKPKGDIGDEELGEFYKFIAHDYQPPLGHLHLSIEGVISFKALLFVPAQAPPGMFREEFERHLHLYVAGVFIQDDCKELLPEYLRFVRGVVDSEDLPLNISREVTQSSPVMAKMRSVLTGKVLGMLEEWATDEPSTYTTFFQQFGQLFKTGLSSDFGNRDRLIDLLRFDSTKTEAGALTSLKDYVARMPEQQEAIYYLLAEHRDSAARNPNLEYFKKHDLEVLLLTDPVDVFIAPSLTEYDEKPFKSIEQADLDLASDDEEPQEDALAETDAEQLLIRFKTTLGDRVEDVIASKRLVDSAATLVVGQGGMDAQMERMMKMMNQDFTGGRKILEVNTHHPLLKNLARLQSEGKDDLLDEAILQLYEGTLLLDGNLPTPADFVQRMTDLMVKATG